MFLSATIWSLHAGNADAVPRRGKKADELIGPIDLDAIREHVLRLPPGDYRIEIGDLSSGARLMNADWRVTENEFGVRSVRAIRFAAPFVAPDDAFHDGNDRDPEGAGTARAGRGPRVVELGPEATNSINGIARSVDSLGTGLVIAAGGRISARGEELAADAKQARARDEMMCTMGLEIQRSIGDIAASVSAMNAIMRDRERDARRAKRERNSPDSGRDLALLALGGVIAVVAEKVAPHARPVAVRILRALGLVGAATPSGAPTGLPPDEGTLPPVPPIDRGNQVPDSIGPDVPPEPGAESDPRPDAQT